MCWNILTDKARYRVPLFLFLAAFTPLVLALISQYFFGLTPCVLCIYQRIVFSVAITCALGSVFVSNKINILKYAIVIYVLIMLTGAGIAFFHVGVEYKWWEGTSHCGTDAPADNIEDLRNQIMNAPLARCDEAEFIFLGLSMAGWNVVYSAAVALFCVGLVRNLKRKEKSNAPR